MACYFVNTIIPHPTQLVIPFFAEIPDNGYYTVHASVYTAMPPLYESCDYTQPPEDSEDYTLSTTEPGNKTDDITLFPNPATTILNIETSLKIERINVYDVSGKLVKTAQNAGKNIDVSRLQNGVYHLEIFTDRGKLFKKFIVNN
ncbi:MAG: T9SS type A sorting domain-containing protein [Flavobacteriaceae bacterium]|jgi:hypothetical protein|nr:T9SS type A sorting domain-containing protein [Flavobacteriaceae bacterium]